MFVLDSVRQNRRTYTLPGLYLLWVLVNALGTSLVPILRVAAFYGRIRIDWSDPFSSREDALAIAVEIGIVFVSVMLLGMMEYLVLRPRIFPARPPKDQLRPAMPTAPVSGWARFRPLAQWLEALAVGVAATIMVWSIATAVAGGSDHLWQAFLGLAKQAVGVRPRPWHPDNVTFIYTEVLPLGREVFYQVTRRLFYGLFGVLLGIVTGLLQFRFLRQRVYRAGWWILVSVIGWSAGMAAFEVALAGVRTVHPLWLGIPFWPEIAAWAVVGEFFGAITGLALAWMVRNPPKALETQGARL